MIEGLWSRTAGSTGMTIFSTSRASDGGRKMTGEMMICLSAGSGGSESISGRAGIFNLSGNVSGPKKPGLCADKQIY